MSQTSDDQTVNVGTAVAAPRAGRFVRDVLALDAPLLLLAAMALITNLGVAVMVPLIPLYAVSLGASPLQLGLLTSAFAITNAVGQLCVGFLSDRFGARSFIRIGIATYAAANALIATAASATMLIAYRALAGLGAGFNLVAERIYLAQIADPKRMAFVNAVLSAAVSVGQVAGPAFGGIVTALSDLRAPFVIVSITSGVSFLASLFLPRPEARSGSQAGMEATAGVRIPWRPIGVLIVAQLFLMAGYGAFITTYAPLATSALGWTTIDVGLLFSVFGAGSIILGPWLSHLADRTGRRRIAVLACLPIALFIASLVAGLPRLTLYVVGFAAGGGITAFGASWYALLAGLAPGARRGRIFGIANALSQLGVVFGAMLASAIWQAADLGAAMLSATVAVLLAGGALLALPDMENTTAPSTKKLSPMRTFDPRKVARYEKEAWVAYYQRRWLRLLYLLVRMVQQAFGLSLGQAIYMSFPLTRAQIRFAPKDNDVSGAEADMRRFYAYVKRVHREDFDPAEAARLEVNWWVVHRKFFARSDSEEVIDAVAKLYAATYGVPYESVRQAAYHRAQAMVYSDRWVNEGRLENSALLAQEEEELIKSYAALRAAVAV